MPLVYERQRPLAVKAENTHSLKDLREEHQRTTIERWSQKDVVNEQVGERLIRHRKVESGPTRNRAGLIEKLKLEAAAKNVLEHDVRHSGESWWNQTNHDIH